MYIALFLLGGQNKQQTVITLLRNFFRGQIVYSCAQSYRWSVEGATVRWVQ